VPGDYIHKKNCGSLSFQSTKLPGLWFLLSMNKAAGLVVSLSCQWCARLASSEQSSHCRKKKTF